MDQEREVRIRVWPVRESSSAVTSSVTDSEHVVQIIIMRKSQRDLQNSMLLVHLQLWAATRLDNQEI